MLNLVVHEVGTGL